MAKIMRIGDALYYKHEMSVQDTFVHKKDLKNKNSYTPEGNSEGYTI